MSISLLVADHQEVMRWGLKSLFQRSAVDVVAEAANEKELMRLVSKHNPQVVLLDVRFNNEDGFVTLNRLKKKHPKLPVLMWSTSENPTYVARSMALGANGYLPRSMERSDMLATIRTAATEGDAWTKDQRTQFTGAPELPADCGVPLTPRERETLRQLAHGLSNKEIALALNISYETVKEHVQHVLRKLSATDRTQAAVWAVRNNLA